jgi:hypothetical protein
MKLISIETQIIRETINALLAGGFLLSVNDGEVTTVNRSVNPDTIFEAMKTTDEDYILVHQINGSGIYGWVRFIYGNDDTEVINDYTTNLERFMAPIFVMIDEFERG